MNDNLDSVIDTSVESTPAEPVEIEAEIPEGLGWDDDDDTTAKADPPETEDDTEAEPETTETPEAEDKPEAVPAEEPKQAEPEVFELKHLGEVKTVSKEEAVSLAQKGMDYDRVKGKLAEHEKVYSFLKTLADSSGLTVDAYIKESRVLALVQNGVDPDVAKQRIELEDEKAAIAAEKARIAEEQAAKDKEAEEATKAQRKRDEDFVAFTKAYPNIKAEDIPKQVWDAVAKGDSLRLAWAEYQLSLKSKADAAASQKAENKKKTPGSMSSAGEKGHKDPFLDGWDS